VTARRAATTAAIVGDDGVIRGPAGEGRVAAVARADVARVARRRWEAPQWLYDAWVSTSTAVKAGDVEAVTDDVRRITGRAPLSLRELLGAQAS
jgi:hypothetical protein